MLYNPSFRFEHEFNLGRCLPHLKYFHNKRNEGKSAGKQHSILSIGDPGYQFLSFK